MTKRWIGPSMLAGALVSALIAAAMLGLLPQLATPLKPVANTRLSWPGDSDSVVLPLTPQIISTPSARLAVTPPMGWNGFNRYHQAVTAAIVKAEARALASSVMYAAGYRYVNLDGGWDLPLRSLDGRLVPDPRKFPDGIKPVGDYVHSLGLKFGIYASAGLDNCARTSAGSYGHYTQDALAFASWGVDYVKLDWCDVPYWLYPQMTHREVSRALALLMKNALDATKRPMVYDINDLANEETWTWAPGMAQLWRNAPDIRDSYSSMVSNFTRTVGHFQESGPGAWNDPDMLEVGNGGMSTTEYQAEFSLWSEMAAPLIAGNDLTTMSSTTLSILTNEAVIAVDQDPLGRQGYPISNTGGHWVLSKPLLNGDRAIVLFNETSTPAVISTTATEAGVPSAPGYTLLNLWTDATSITPDVIAASVAAHGVVMLIVHRGRGPRDRIAT